MHKRVIPEADNPAFRIIRPEYREMAATIAESTGLLPTQGNQVSIVPVSTDRFQWMLQQLREARKSIYIDMYRFRVDSGGVFLYSILEEKARAGLDVRIILLFPYGSIPFIDNSNKLIARCFNTIDQCLVKSI